MLLSQRAAAADVATDAAAAVRDAGEEENDDGVEIARAPAPRRGLLLLNRATCAAPK